MENLSIYQDPNIGHGEKYAKLDWTKRTYVEHFYFVMYLFIHCLNYPTWDIP
jgi:hypothetical protein